MSLSTYAIITGASRGLGLALAQGLLQAGTGVLTLARSHNAELEAQAVQAGGSLRQIQVDLADAAAAQRCAAQLADCLPRDAQRYLLINNAGSVDPVRSAAGLDDAAAIGAALTLNVASVMLLSAAFLSATRGLDAQRRVVNISSGAGRNPVPGWAVYCATKAAVDRYTQVAAAENPDARFASLAPGVIDTAMQGHIRDSDPADFPGLARFVDMHAGGQLAAPAAVAAKILRYVNRDDFGSTIIDDIRNYD
ncbi:SDR family NAD(P)-dependent oxidoreductase [Candidimonas nitroreducens]|uniref:Short-chain dehydrogenase n=1 Tax=Candidimonas nitroreducens TaxID=683354 RepID=A0A225MWV2_9BURK|nr:SDR family NAD(P)-dependent oxidoreductase [Candidimonas nitroreducens]OWT65705.1 short-chain dehydrogenase [Candidimonas nitroreducens]